MVPSAMAFVAVLVAVALVFVPMSVALFVDQILRKRADRIKPSLVGRRQKVLKRRQDMLAELRLAHTREPPVCAEALHKPLNRRIRQHYRNRENQGQRTSHSIL